MSTRPTSATNAPTCCSLDASTVSRSKPWTVAPFAASSAPIPGPIPWAVPVTIATRPLRSGIPAVLDQVAHLGDARIPDSLDVLVRALVHAAERPVAEQLAYVARIELPHLRDVRHRLLLVRQLDTGQPRPREVLEPGCVRCLGINLVDDGSHAVTRPP